MKNKIFPTLMLLGITGLLSSCDTLKDSSSGGMKTSDSKEAFFDFSYSDHVKALKISQVQISTIQMYASKAFQLTATSRSQSTLIEEGVLVLDKVNLGTIIKFKDKIKGIVIEGGGTTLTVQFHNGSDENIGPPIKFSAIGNGLYRIVLNNKGDLLYRGVNYTSSATDVVLMIKFKERTSSEQKSFSASGIEVVGSSGSEDNSDDSDQESQQENNGNNTTNSSVRDTTKVDSTKKSKGLKEAVDPN